MQPPSNTEDGRPETNSPKQKRLIKVTFAVRALVRPEQHVRVLGSAPNLGWDFDRGLQLEETSGPDGASPPGLYRPYDNI